LFNRIISNEPLTIFGNGDQIRDYVFIQDLIPIFDKSIISNIADNQIVNLGTGIGTTIKEIIQNLSKILQVSPKLDYLQERPGEIGNFVADTNKLEKIFGPQQFTNVELGLEKTVSWLQNTKNH
jgi:UDP-glucose 4-epimerase